MIKFLKHTIFMFILSAIFFALGALVCSAASLEVSPIFADNMILQQNQPIRIWGTSESEGSSVTAIMGDSVGSEVVKNGKWEIELAERCFSDDIFTLEVYDSEGEYESFENIMIGDVWWILGQSNVEYTSSASDEFEKFAETISGDEKIRVLSLKTDSFTENNIRWRNFSRYSTYNAGALGTFFIKKISDSVNNEIPLAVVNMGFGGREISDFLPRGEIYKNVLLYAERMPIAGLVWYQGESDAAKYFSYAQKLTEFLNILREKKDGVFPVYSIELPPCFNNTSKSNWQYADFGLVRGESCGITKDVSNFYVCPTGDLWKNKEYENNIHPNNKAVIANRLALMVLSKEYGFGMEELYFGPVVKSIRYEGENRKKVIIEFSNAGEGLQGGKEGFTVLNDDFSKISDFAFRIDGKDRIVICADENISCVRYGTDTASVFQKDRNLASSYNVPASAFSYTLFRKTTDIARRYILLVICISVVIFSILTAAIKEGKK